MKDKTTSFHWEVRESHSDFIGLSNSRLNISHVPWWWSISRNFSRLVIFCVHINHILTNMHTILQYFSLNMQSVSFIWVDYVQKCWSGHKFPHCAMEDDIPLLQLCTEDLFSCRGRSGGSLRGWSCRRSWFSWLWLLDCSFLTAASWPSSGPWSLWFVSPSLPVRV